MTRQEVYDLCTERITGYADTVRLLLPKEAVDAIIDCAKEEVIEYLKEYLKKNPFVFEMGGTFLR